MLVVDGIINDGTQKLHRDLAYLDLVMNDDLRKQKQPPKGRAASVSTFTTTATTTILTGFKRGARD